jgi:hypothetical protein
MARCLVLIMLLCGYACSWSQIPTTGALLWLRADTLVTYVTPSGASPQVASWKSRVGGHTATAAAGSVLGNKQINGQSGIFFSGASYLEAPSIFPVGKDYTIYLVTEWSGVHSANNMLSGQNRALFTSSPGQPTILHSGDFNRLLMAESALSGPTVVRITYSETTRTATISYNGKEVASGEIPSNIDSVIYIGAYQRGYCYNGTVSEIILYNRITNAQERDAVESYLHQRYAIKQYKEPPPRPVTVMQAPKQSAVLEPNQPYDIVYRVNTATVRSVVVRTETFGLPRQITTYDVNIGSTKTIPWTSAPVGFDASSVVIMADTGGAALDTVYRATDIVSGSAFTITGQSNSIFGDASLLPSAYARTFGKNFSSSASDTVFYGSKADGNGGGAHVGAWGLYLQNAIADQMGMPSLCINGGVGGTRIEQHLPDGNNRLNRATIYGSWLYRIVKSGRQNDIRWLFWYQGESNHDTEDYIKLFGQLYEAWKEDLPNLAYVVVVQIRPGCAGPLHAKLRDQQRRLEYEFPNVIVHAANALPAHDGCHYGGLGYGTLGRQLFDVYRINELGMQPGVYRSSPTVKQAVAISSTDVRVEFSRGDGIYMTSDVLVNGTMRAAREAWFANGNGRIHPLSVTVEAPSVILKFPVPVQSLSYVPDYTYDDGATIFQGPWLVRSDGVGALSFHDIPVTTTSVGETQTECLGASQRLIGRSTLPLLSFVQNADALYDISGSQYGLQPEVLQSLLPGFYTVIFQGQPISIVVVP